MDHNQLKCFLVTAKDRSFTKASRELFISQPAISTVSYTHLRAHETTE